MKYFNRVFAGLILAFGFVGYFSIANAGNIPKESYYLAYTTTVSTVTPVVSATTSVNANAAYMPGAVYQITLSSGATGDYFAMYDSTSSVGVTCGNVISVSSQTNLSGHFLYQPSSAAYVLNGAGVVNFSPPLVFHNGLVVCNSASADAATVTYELGRGLSGQ